MSANEEIRIATWDDESRISAMMCLAFATDPMVRRLLPRPFKYLKASEKHPGLSTGPAFDHGSAYVLGDCFGAALWLPPGIEVDPKPMASNLETNADPTVLDDFGLLLDKAEFFRPDEPHWYLSLIAVDPIHRGKGYGELLMSYALGICDRDKRPAYLESTNAANLRLYKRCGFKLLAEVRVGQFERYPMLRRPI